MGVVSVRCENARAAVAAIQPTSLVRWRRGLQVGDGTSSAETLDPYRSYVYRLIKSYTSLALIRTNIDIDNDLLTEAMAATGLQIKKATVEEALRRLVQRARRRKGAGRHGGARLER